MIWILASVPFVFGLRAIYFVCVCVCVLNVWFAHREIQGGR